MGTPTPLESRLSRIKTPGEPVIVFERVFLAFGDNVILKDISFELRAGYTKIALGHHRDDLVATFFLNLFFHSKLGGMPPKLLSDDGKHVVIRPLAYVREDDIAAYAEAKQFPIIPCNLCGSQENLQRKQVSKMMATWERETPGRIEQIARALGDIRPSQLSDPKLFDFLSLGQRGDGALPDAHAWLGGGDGAAETQGGTAMP